jgi:hypothetical protein
VLLAHKLIKPIPPGAHLLLVGDVASRTASGATATPRSSR